jgi:hypothetical protein
MGRGTRSLDDRVLSYSLGSGWCAGSLFRKNGERDQASIFRQTQGSNRQEHGNILGGLRRSRRLVGQMAVGAPRIVRCVVTIPVGYNNRGKYKQCEGGERKRQYANYLTYIHSSDPWPCYRNRIHTNPVLARSKYGVIGVLHLQHVSLLCDHFVQHRVHEESQEQARNQSRDNDDRERFLRV